MIVSCFSTESEYMCVCFILACLVVYIFYVFIVPHCVECSFVSRCSSCMLQNFNTPQESIPVLSYGLEVCSLQLTEDELHALDFAVTPFLMKSFNTSSIAVIKDSCRYFGFKLPSELLEMRFKNLCSNVISDHARGYFVTLYSIILGFFIPCLFFSYLFLYMHVLPMCWYINVQSMEIINTCREEFKFSLPTQQISVRNAKFLWNLVVLKLTLWNGIVSSCNLQLISCSIPLIVLLLLLLLFF